MCVVKNHALFPVFTFKCEWITSHCNKKTLLSIEMANLCIAICILFICIASCSRELFLNSRKYNLDDCSLSGGEFYLYLGCRWLNATNHLTLKLKSRCKEVCQQPTIMGRFSEPWKRKDMGNVNEISLSLYTLG